MCSFFGIREDFVYMECFKPLCQMSMTVFHFKTKEEALMQTFELPPYAPTLIESTRAIGYSLEAAVADIIDL